MPHKWFDILELVRFAVVGGSSASVYVAALVLMSPPMAVVSASVIAYALAIVANYTFQKLWTFKSRRPHRETAPRFLATHAGGILINAGALYLLESVLGWSFVTAQFAALAMVATWSYLLQKAWVFTNSVAV